jgi:hypothetical protein
MFQDFILKQKENYLQVLMSKYEKAYNHLSSTLNEDDKPSIEAKIKQLEKDIKNVNKEIDELRLNPEKGRDVATKARQEEEGANRVKEENKTQTIIEHKQKVAEMAGEEALDFFSKVYREYDQQWEGNLHEINFSQANPIIQTNLERFKNRSGYSLFLLKESTSMKGDCCLQIIESFLGRMGTLHSRIKFQFKPHQSKTNRELLNGLADKLCVDKSENIQKYTDNIVEKICNSLCSGHILFIHIEIPSLPDEDRFLNLEDRFLVWFVKQLWNKLISRLKELGKTHHSIRAVGVISVHTPVSEEFLPRKLCCECGTEDFDETKFDETKFDETKFLEIPLERWKESEIRNWLINFSGLTAPQIGVSEPLIDEMARSIFEASNGLPSVAYTELKKQLTEVIKDKFE